jgi:hypothetical protein
LIDALSYAPGSILCRVELGGEIIESDDKVVATERTVIAMANVSVELRTFARWCALQVIDLWDAPEVVRQYLETGDETIRAAAGDAAGDAVRATARDAARDTAWDAARAAAWAAAGDAARAAVGATRATRAATWAARAAAGDTAWDAWDACWELELNRVMKEVFGE